MCDPAPSGQKSSQGQKRPPTRSMERTDERHRQSSEMHRSIERNDFGQMKKLLDWGEHFCTGEGLNCFIFAALMPGAKAGTRWKMVKRMLDLDVSGLTARNADGTTLLMIYSNDKECIQHLIQMGANIRDVDKLGRSALLRSFCHPEPNLKAFDELLSYEDDDEVIRKLVVSMVEEFSSVRKANALTAAKMMYRVLNSKEVDFSKYEVHPVVRAIEKLHENNNYCYLLKRMLPFCTKFAPNGPIIVQRDISCGQYLEWSLIKQRHEIPDIAVFDLPGYFLYCINMRLANDAFVEYNQEHIEIFKSLLIKCSANVPVVNPMVALLYNIIQKCWNFDQELPRSPFDFPPPCSPLWWRAHLYYRTMTENAAKQKVVAFSNAEVQCILQLLSHLAVVFNGNLFNIILDLLPQSPTHPYIHIGKFREAITSLPAHENRLRDFIQYFVGGVWMRFHGRDNSGFDVKGLSGATEFFAFFSQLNRVQNMHPVPSVAIEMVEKLKSKDISLKNLSRWALRAAIAQHILHKKILLSTFIKALSSRGYMPANLGQYVLFYPDV